jgi:hypothetical protein
VEPVTVNCTGSCTVTHQVEISLPPFQLDAAEGAAIASAVLAVWATAYAFRVVIRMLRSSDSESNPESES